MLHNFKNINYKKKIIMAIGLCSIALITASYAFFNSFVSGPANTNVDISSGVTEKFIFTPGENLNLVANQENLAQGAGSLRASTTSTATLIADSTVGSASRTYNAYFDIVDNDYIYTFDENTPELLLKVTGPDGNVLTSIQDLTYKTVVDASTGENLSGFDITTFQGLIKLEEEILISTTSSSVGTVQEWTAEIIFVNLDTNQAHNAGKTLSADFILQVEKVLINEMISGSAFQSKMGYSNIRSIDNIVFSSDVSALDGITTTKYDLSNLGDNSIVGYIVGTDANMTLNIVSNRKIVANVDSSKLFYNFKDLKSIVTNDWFDTSYTENMSYMFYGVDLLNISLNFLNTKNATNLNYLFSYTNNLNTAHIEELVTGHLVEFVGVFENANLLNVSLNSLDLSNVEDISFLFSETLNLKSEHVAVLSKSKPIKLESLFKYTDLNNVDVSTLDLSSATNVNSMFFGSDNLDFTLVENFDVSNVVNMSYMFSEVEGTVIDLSNYNIKAGADLTYMFAHSFATAIYLPSLNAVSSSDISPFRYMLMKVAYYNDVSINTVYVKSSTDMQILEKTVLELHSQAQSETQFLIEDYVNTCVSYGVDYETCMQEAYYNINSGWYETYLNINYVLY